ncbi:MAG: carboxypeptidase-like regulatory domain-containing protein [Bacteroidota bacterium]
MTYKLLLLLILSHGVNCYAQQKKLIQFSGVVVSGDNLMPVQFVNIIIKNSFRGTTSDYFGYFSFVAQKKDTIVFSSVGYKKGEFVIPDSITSNRYSLIQMLIKDTILLKETVIYPWPTKEQFKQAFLNFDIPDDDLERANKNLARAELKEQFEATGMDASMNFKNYMQQENSKLYYAGFHSGQSPPINLLNPIAWAKFIEAWKNGDFKKKKKE